MTTYTSIWVAASAAGTGYSSSVGAVHYATISGALSIVNATTEAYSQIKLRSTLTIKNLFVRVTANTCTGSSTIYSRKNTANANLTVTIGASATGIFEDVTHNDAPSVGDFYNYAISPVSGILTISIISVTADSSSNGVTPLLIGGNTTSTSGAVGYNGWVPVSGNLNTSMELTTESHVQWTTRYAGTASNLQIYGSCVTGDTNGSNTVTFRKNGANGNQTIGVAAGTSGFFEDVTHTDSLVAGDKIDYSINISPSTTTTTNKSQHTAHGASTVSFVCCQLVNSTGHFSLIAGNPVGQNVAAATAEYLCMGGDTAPSTTEANAQLKLRGGPYTANYLFVNVTAVGVAETVYDRDGGSSQTLTTTLTLSTPGLYEDTSHSDTMNAADLINLLFSSASTNTVSVTVASISFSPGSSSTPITASDSGSGLESAVTPLLPMTDAGSGVDAQVESVTLGPSDSGSGLDGTPLAALLNTDLGSGLESIPKVTQAQTDVGSGSDALIITLNLVEVGSGSDSKLQQYGITGLVKDQSGNGISGATVELYTASDDTFRQTTTSAGDGSYRFLVSNESTQYFVRAYHDSYLGQRVFGVTDRTLVG